MSTPWAAAEMGSELAGWTVVVTRDEGDDGPLGRALADGGATVLRVPTVGTAPPDDARELEAALAGLGRFDWVVFTSPRAVDALAGLGMLEASVASAARSEGLRVAVVGPSTAERAVGAGLVPTVVGSGEGAEDLARELVRRGIGPDTEVFFPASSRARPDLARVLRKAGARVRQVTAYRTEVIPLRPEEHPGLGEADVVTFTSPSAVEGWCAASGNESTGLPDGPVPCVVIGPTTETAARARGLAVIRAPEASFEGVVEAVRRLAAEGHPDRGSRE